MNFDNYTCDGQMSIYDLIPENKDKYDIAEAISLHAVEIAQEIADAQEIQKSDESQHTKECAKITAYDHIIELIVGRGE